MLGPQNLGAGAAPTEPEKRPYPNLSDSSFGSLESTNADGLARGICETQRVDHPHPYPLPSRERELIEIRKITPALGADPALAGAGG